MSTNSPQNHGNSNTHIGVKKTRSGDMTVTEGMLFQGPMPHPDILEKYNSMIPDAAERILTMAENQASHRQELEKGQASHRQELEKRIENRIEKIAVAEVLVTVIGQVCALFIVVAYIFAGAFCVIKGYTAGGSILGSVGIAGVVSAFIYRHRESKPAKKK